MTLYRNLTSMFGLKQKHKRNIVKSSIRRCVVLCGPQSGLRMKRSGMKGSLVLSPVPQRPPRLYNDPLTISRCLVLTDVNLALERSVTAGRPASRTTSTSAVNKAQITTSIASSTRSTLRLYLCRKFMFMKFN